LRESFSIFEDQKTNHIDALDLCIILRLMDSNVSDQTLHGLVRHAVGKEGVIDLPNYEKLLVTSRDSFTSLKLPQLVEELKKIKKDAGFAQVIEREFPGQLHEREFVEKSYETLHKHGFSKNNTIACVALCRDEICKPLGKLLLRTWGETFELSSLGGMLFAGKTGMGAAIHHAPQRSGFEHYLFICMPHIAIDEMGNIGAVYRPGRAKISNACGALMAFKSEYDSGKVKLEIDLTDIEYSLMKQKLLRGMEYGSKPSLVELTKLAQKLVLEDLEHLISLSVDTKKANYAVMSGIQIHGPQWIVRNKDLDTVWLTQIYIVVQGKRVDLKLGD